MLSLVRRVGRLVDRVLRPNVPVPNTVARTIPGLSTARVPPRAATGPGAGPGLAGAGLREGMAELLASSAELDHIGARDDLYALVLRQLSPDEARILAVLSDGTPFPALDVVGRTLLGRTTRVVLRHASTVGKAAGVSLPDHVPAYVTRLLALGLADLDTEDPALDTQYEILLTDETVIEAVREAGRAGFVRRTLRITTFGSRFWTVCGAPDMSTNDSLLRMRRFG